MGIGRLNAATVVLLTLLGLMNVGCRGRSMEVLSPSPTPVTPRPPSPAPPASSQANWTANATVLSSVGGHACGWGTTVGETRALDGWRVVISGTTVSLDEDMGNWPTDDVPYTGTLTGQTFTAKYEQSADYLNYVCQFRGGTLTGTFNADFTTFDAHEVLVWGAPGQETTVERHWTGAAM